MLVSSAVNIFGKLAGLILGFAFFGPIGLIVGLALGHIFDVTVERHSSSHSNQNDTENLLPVLFSLFGRVAGFGKSFSQGQAFFIQSVVIPRLGLSPWDHNLAIRTFRESLETTLADSDAEITDDVRSLAAELASNFFLDRRTLLWIHATCRQVAALGVVRLGLINILDTIAHQFGIFDETGSAGFEHNSSKPDDESYRHEWSSFRPGTEAGPDAYQALGVSTNATNDEVKKAYRELVRKYHPDRLQHLTENDVEKKRSQERFLSVQHAYERIRKERHF